jgi:tRNA(Arg) A34 adenosine deaminase TadA
MKLGTEHLTGTTIYVLAHPCPMCLGSLYYCSPDEVIFLTTRDSFRCATNRERTPSRSIGSGRSATAVTDGCHGRQPQSDCRKALFIRCLNAASKRRYTSRSVWPGHWSPVNSAGSSGSS